MRLLDHALDVLGPAGTAALFFVLALTIGIGTGVFYYAMGWMVE